MFALLDGPQALDSYFGNGRQRRKPIAALSWKRLEIREMFLKGLGLSLSLSLGRTNNGPIPGSGVWNIFDNDVRLYGTL